MDEADETCAAPWRPGTISSSNRHRTSARLPTRLGQRLLNMRDTDGVFGPETTAAVEFQKAHGWTSTGGYYYYAEEK